MLENRDHDISVLNSLITTIIDSADGYERSAENVRGGKFESLFTEFAQERRQLVGQLQEHVRLHGGEANDDGSLMAGLHRRFEDLKNAFGGGDKAIINEVERGEDYILAKFEQALEDDRLSSDCRAIVEEAFHSVGAGHDEMSQLKHRLENA